MRRIGIVFPLALLVCVGLVGADEKHQPGQQVQLDRGRLTVWLPRGWEVGLSADGTRFEARSPERDGDLWIRLRGTSRPIHRGETFDAYAGRMLDEARGATLLDDGFRIIETQNQRVAQIEARLFLAERAKAAPPMRTLFAVLGAGQGWVLQFDTALGRFGVNRTRILEILDSITSGRMHAPGRRFEREIPELLTLRSIGAARIVELANEKRRFGREDDAAWVLAQEAWQELLAETGRLQGDPAHRVAMQRLANVASDRRHEGLYWAWRWANPYLLVWPSAYPTSKFDEQLDATPNALAAAEARGVAAAKEMEPVAQVLTWLYRDVLARLGERHHLRDLMSPFGGRPELARSNRSFPEGVPLPVTVHASKEAVVKFALDRWGQQIPANAIAGAMRLRDELHVVAAPARHRDAWRTRVASAGGGQLLWWFTRQRSKWSMPKPGSPGLWDGYASWLGSVGDGRGGRLVRTRYNMPLVKAARELDAVLKRRGRGGFPLTVDLRRYLAAPTHAAVLNQLATRHGMSGAAGLIVHEVLSWSFVAFLHETNPEGFHRLLEAILDRQVGLGMTEAVVARALGLRGEAGWTRLEAAWQAWIAVQVLGLEAPPAAAPTAPRVRRIRLRVANDGTVLIRGGALRGRDTVVRLSLADREPASLARQLVTLRQALRTQVDGLRTQDPKARLQLRIDADPFVSWQWIQWVMQIAADPQIAIRDIQLRHTGIDAGHDVRLPSDRGLRPADFREAPALDVRVLRPSGRRRRTEVQIAETRVPITALEALVPVLKVHHAAHPDAVVTVKAPPLRRGDPIPWQEMYAVLDLVRSVGFENIQFEGSAAPTLVPGRGGVRKR